jgi:hypothetical protein
MLVDRRRIGSNGIEAVACEISDCGCHGYQDHAYLGESHENKT